MSMDGVPGRGDKAKEGVQVEPRQAEEEETGVQS